MEKPKPPRDLSPLSEPLTRLRNALASLQRTLAAFIDGRTHELKGLPVRDTLRERFTDAFQALEQIHRIHQAGLPALKGRVNDEMLQAAGRLREDHALLWSIMQQVDSAYFAHHVDTGANVRLEHALRKHHKDLQDLERLFDQVKEPPSSSNVPDRSSEE